METIIYRDEFYEAERATLSCVACVWDRAHGGQIVDYVYLGWADGRGVAIELAEALGFVMRQDQPISARGMTVEIDGTLYTRPHHIHVFEGVRNGDL